MKLKLHKLAIVIFTVILCIFYFQIVSCKKITGYNPSPPPNIDGLEDDFVGPHFTNEKPTIHTKINYKYYNAIEYSNKPEQERVLFYVKTDNKDADLRQANCRRIIESPILDIYVDLSKYRGVVQKSVNFGLDNWIKLLNSFYSNYQKMVDVYGNHCKIYNGGKIDILFVDLIKYENGSRMNGYFSSRDIDYRISWAKNWGNKRQILYLTSSFLDEKNIDEMMNTLFHEFQHLINYSWYFKDSRKPMETWLNEALSESTYYITHGNIPNTNRFKYYNNSQEIKKGASFYSWIYESTDSYINASMFMYWLYLYGGGEKIINNIAYDNGRNKPNYQIVENAIKNNFPSQYKIQVSDWGKILGSWYSANFSKSSSGLESYLGKYYFNPQIITTACILNLAPGEGLYIDPLRIDTKYSSSDIVQKNLSSVNKNSILIFNKNTKNNTNTIYLYKKGDNTRPNLIKRIPYMDPNVWIDEIDEN